MTRTVAMITSDCFLFVIARSEARNQSPAPEIAMPAFGRLAMTEKRRILEKLKYYMKRRK